MLVIRGDAVHSSSYGALECLEDAVFVVDEAGALCAVDQGCNEGQLLLQYGVPDSEVIRLQVFQQHNSSLSGFALSKSVPAGPRISRAWFYRRSRACTTSARPSAASLADFVGVTLLCRCPCSISSPEQRQTGH
jgi:hypothetical protein